MLVRETHNSIAIVRFAHGKVSALDAEFCTALEAEVAAIAATDLTALVLTGTGSAFSAGVDLYAVLNGGGEYTGRFLPALDTFFRTLLTFPKPLVGAINGHAIAGGCIVAAACDYRVMASGHGRIGVPELIVGVPFPALPFEIMAARLAPQVLRDLVFSGRVVEPDEAAALSLVDEVVEPDALLNRALSHAERLSRIPAATFALTKRALAERVLHGVERASASNAEIMAAWRSPEVHAAIRAYMDRTVRKSS
jgi:enoyl-CoA hydratase